MKIGQKITLGFLLMPFLIGMVGYIAVRAGEESLTHTIGNSSVILTQEALKSIDREIYKRIEELMIGTVGFMMQEILMESNQQYGMLPDPRGYVLEKDKEWVSVPKEVVTPFMRQFIDTRLSRELKEKIDIYQQKYGHKVLGEIFVTNTYGANVAQTGKTTDFKQDDEDWWRLAMENGIYVGDVEYDESADINSLDLGVRVDGKNGEFLGVVKSVLNIEEVESIIQGVRKNLGYKTSEMALFSKEQNLIYSTGSFGRMGQAYGVMVEHEEQKPHWFRAIAGGRQKLISYAQSKGYKDFAGLGWALMIEYDTDEILRPVLRLRNTLIVVLLAGILLAVLVGYLITRSIAVPLHKLGEGVQKIMKGDWNTKIDIRSKDEIGSFAWAFNTMTVDLKRHNDKLVAEKTYIDSVLRAVGECVIVIDTQGTIEVFNETAERVFDYAASEVIGKNIQELMPVGFREKHRQGLKNYNETGRPRVIGKGHVELEGLRRSGRVFPIELTVSEMIVADTGRKVFIGIIRDISIHKQALEQIVATAKFPDESPNPVLRIAKDGNILYANKSSRLLLKAWDGQVGQKLTEHWTETVQDVLASGKMKEMEMSISDSVYSLTLVPFAESAYVNIYGFDITERKKARRKLEESEAQVSAIVKAAIDGIITVNDQGIVQMFNPAAGVMFGYAPEEVLGQHVRMLLPAAVEKSQYEQYISSYLKAGKSKVFGSSQRVSGRHKNGTMIGLDLSLSEMVMASGQRLFIGIVRNVN
jgi:PAS domain S-box-containing protein